MRPSGRAQSRFLLANQILEFICERKLTHGRHLVETALAERFDISRTLVRSALKVLAAQDVVEARRNQGFFLLRSWDEVADRSVDVPPSAEDDLYLALLRDRIDRHLPERITQVALLERYRVDRAILLRTLSRMADEGIVTKNKGHGWTFAPAIDTEAEVRNSYDFRLVVEPALFRLDSFAADEAVLRRLRATHLAMLENAEAASSLRLFEIDADFHEALAGFSRNAFFLQAVKHQNRMRRLLEYRGYSNRRRIRDWVREHVGILDALLAGEEDLAAERMRAHLGRAHRAAKTQGRAAPAGA